MTGSDTEPPSPESSTKEHTIKRTVLAALAAVSILLTAACGGSDTRLADAYEEVGDQYGGFGAALLDDGQGLALDGLGRESLGLTPDMTEEFLDYLEMPETILMSMYSTRALDGTQTATWDGIVATWTYHPDAGLDIILTYEDN